MLRIHCILLRAAKWAKGARYLLAILGMCAALCTHVSALKVGMVPDTGTVNDKSFNQGTWEGICRARNEGLVECVYRDPTGNSEAEYMTQIEALIDDGCDMIICAGFTFETAIFAAQYRWPNIKFVILDGATHNEDYSLIATAQNTVGITWQEHESGFVAGIAAAVQVQEGDVGFIGGMEIPAVQRYNWGWQRGIAYANWQYGTNISIKEENTVYQGTFDDVDGGRKIAREMYDRGVRVIFAAAGAVGMGVIEEAKERRTHLTEKQEKDGERATKEAREEAIRQNNAGRTAHKSLMTRLMDAIRKGRQERLFAVAANDVWVVGVDVDQYEAGMMNNGKSCILTSACKDIGLAAYSMIKDVVNDKWKGGSDLVLSSRTGGVGIPSNNLNLSEEAQSKALLALKHMSYNVVKVRGDGEGLIK